MGEEKSTQPAKKLLVWLHGTSENGSVAPFDEMKKRLPDCHFIAPDGPHGYDGAYFDYSVYSASQIAQQRQKRRKQFVSLQCIKDTYEKDER